MKLPDNPADILLPVERYYTEKVREHGPTAPGADWNSEASQQLRFEQLLRVVRRPSEPFSVNDYGCGYGALAQCLADRGWNFTYTGFDISEEMLMHASSCHAGRPGCRFTRRASDLEPADYTLASGIFNVKLGADPEEWRQYLLETLSRFDALSRRGFAFNALTSYSDPGRMREGLYYADPCFLFDHCRRRFSRSVALLHDYGLYEFTIIVKKDEEGVWQG